MTFKKLLAVCIALLIGVSVVACAKVEIQMGKVTSEENYVENVELERWGAFTVISSEWIRLTGSNGSLKQLRVYDPDTNVEYVIVGNGYTVECVPLYNADGTLKLYNPNNAGAN